MINHMEIKYKFRLYIYTMWRHLLLTEPIARMFPATDIDPDMPLLLLDKSCENNLYLILQEP